MSVVQPVFSSSYLGFGLATGLERDILELLLLLSSNEMNTIPKLVLVGHSTGCQVLLKCITSSAWRSLPCEARNRVHSIVLQGPVSDRESFLGDAHMRQMISWACPTSPQTEGNGVFHLSDTPEKSQLCPLGYFCGAAINAGRLRSLLCRLGEEDLFSTDLSEKEVASQLILDLCKCVAGNNGQFACLDNHEITGARDSVAKIADDSFNLAIVLSGNDQYVPDRHQYAKFFDKTFSPVLQRCFPACAVSTHVIPEADHACSNACEAITSLILSVC